MRQLISRADMEGIHHEEPGGRQAGGASERDPQGVSVWSLCHQTVRNNTGHAEGTVLQGTWSSGAGGAMWEGMTSVRSEE